MPEAIFSPASTDALVSPVRRVYLFAGEDEHQKGEALGLLRAACLDPAFADFDYEEIDAATTAPDDILASANLAPFGSPHRLVVTRGAEVYRKHERAKDAERICQGIGSLGASSCLVLWAGSGEDERGSGRTALTSRIDAAVKAAGLILRCRALTAEALRDLTIARARATGKRLDEEAADLLVRVSRSDRRSLDNELEKSICYVGERPSIVLADVEAVCSYDSEDVMFRLVDAIGQRNTDRAMVLFREILRYDTRPQSVAGRLLALLARQFRLLWQSHELMERRIQVSALKQLPEEIAADLPTDGSIAGLSWKAGDLYRQARSWNRRSLRGAFDAIVQTDVANKGSGEKTEDVVMNLELLILELCRAG